MLIIIIIIHRQKSFPIYHQDEQNWDFNPVLRRAPFHTFRQPIVPFSTTCLHMNWGEVLKLSDFKHIKHIKRLRLEEAMRPELLNIIVRYWLLPYFTFLQIFRLHLGIGDIFEILIIIIHEGNEEWKLNGVFALLDYDLMYKHAGFSRSGGHIKEHNTLKNILYPNVDYWEYVGTRKCWHMIHISEFSIDYTDGIQQIRDSYWD